MEAINNNKGLIAIAVLLALVLGVSAYNSGDNEAQAPDAESSEQRPADKNQDDQQVASDSDEASKKQDKTDDSSADTDNEATADKDEPAAEPDEASQSADSYAYTAQSGDSYTVLARKAVQTYGIINNVKLSLAEILAAETKLTTDAGASYLNEGQSVSIDQADVKSAIDYAQALSDDEEALWATYVPYVDFDTRKNGE